MRKVAVLSILVFLVNLTFVTSCADLLPGPDTYIKLHQIYEEEITLSMLNTILSDHNIEIPFLDIEPGSAVYAVIIPFNVGEMSDKVTYDKVWALMNIFEKEGSDIIEDTDNIKVIAAIPDYVERYVDVEEESEIAAKVEASVSKLTGNVGAGITKKESYNRFYRTVRATMDSPTNVLWTFEPFKDEPVFPGKYYVFALIEVREQAQEVFVQVNAHCMYGASYFFGLMRETNRCYADSSNLSLMEPVSPVVRAPLEELSLTFGGDKIIEEAVLHAVDWSSLISNQSPNIALQDINGHEVDISTEIRDVEHCKQLLAEFGYPDGYSFSLGIWPASDELLLIATELQADLADCAIEGEIQTFTTYHEAYQKLTINHQAGISGALLSTQIED